MFHNKLKKDLYDGKTCYGTFLNISSTDVAEIVGRAGFDFVLVDNEHGNMGPETSADLVRALEVSGTTPLLRVTYNDETKILRSLDIGAHGLLIPQINDAEAARLAVSRSKFYPLGQRGIGIVRSWEYGISPPADEYFDKANAETLVSVQCENLVGLKNLEEIAQIDGIDVIFFGPFDISQSMGIPGKTDDPQVHAAEDRVIEVCEKYGKIPGIYCHDMQRAQEKAKKGFRFVAMGVVGLLIAREMKRLVTGMKEA